MNLATQMAPSFAFLDGVFGRRTKILGGSLVLEVWHP